MPKEETFGIVFATTCTPLLNQQPGKFPKDYFVTLKYTCMLTQKLRNIYNFFFTGKKNISSSNNLGNTPAQISKNTKGKVQLLYRRDINGEQGITDKTAPLQHDWWIN